MKKLLIATSASIALIGTCGIASAHFSAKRTAFRLTKGFYNTLINNGSMNFATKFKTNMESIIAGHGHPNAQAAVNTAYQNILTQERHVQEMFKAMDYKSYKQAKVDPWQLGMCVVSYKLFFKVGQAHLKQFMKQPNIDHYMVAAFANQISGNAKAGLMDPAICSGHLVG